MDILTKIVKIIEILLDLEENKIIILNYFSIHGDDIIFTVNSSKIEFNIKISSKSPYEIELIRRSAVNKSIPDFIQLDKTDDISSLKHYFELNKEFLLEMNLNNDYNSNKFKIFNYLIIYLSNKIIQLESINKSNYHCKFAKDKYSDQLKFYFPKLLVTLDNSYVKIYYNNGSENRNFIYECFFNDDNQLYLKSKFEEILKSINKNIVKCSCGENEYEDYMIWKDGKQYCRKCTYKRWEQESNWKQSEKDKIFPDLQEE